MNNRPTLRLALIVTAVLVFAAVLMGVFVFTASGATANAEVGRYQLGSDLYVELYLNDELADYSLYDEFPGEKFQLDTSYPDYSIRALFYDGQENSISTKSYYRWLDVTLSETEFRAPQETMYEEQGTHVKCWYRADDPATTLAEKTVIAYTYFEVSKSKLPDGVVKIGGDFGPDYMVNERDHYREGESTADRIVLDSDGGNIDTTGLTVTTVKWKAGTQTEMDLFDNTWSDDWDAFYAETTWAGTQMTFGVVVSSNDQYLSTVCTVPFTVHKNKVYVRPVQKTFEYWGNAITPTVKFYEHRVSEDCLVANPNGTYANATAPQGDVGTYPVHGRLDSMNFTIMQNYEVVNDDPEAYFTIVPRTLAFTWTIGETTLTGAEWAEYRNDPGSPKDQNVVWFPAAFTYNGAEQLPELTVTNRGFYTPEIHVSGATKEQYDGSVWTTVSSFVLPDCVGYRYEITAVDEHNYVLPTDGSTIIEFRILRAPLTLSWTPDDFIYDGTGKSVTATITGGILSGEEVSIGGYSNNTKIGAGDYVASVTFSGNNASNYTADGHAWSIAKAALTVKANDNSITYGDAPAGNGVTYIGFVDSEDESGITGTLTFTYGYEQYGAVGNSYTITPAGLTHSDYDITFTAGILTVEKKALTIKACDLSVTYGTGSIVFMPEYVDFVGTDDESVLTGLDTLTYLTAYEQYEDVGVYDVTVSGSVSATNYTIEYGVGALTVEQLEATISWLGLEGFTTVYNGAEQTVVTGATVSNKVNNDDVSLTVTGGKGTNVSNETHLATAALAGAKAGNYKLPADPTHFFTITPKPVSVSAIADDMTYSGEEKGVEASYTNALGQDVNIASAQITYTNYVSRVNYTGNSFYAYAEVIDSNYTLVGGGNTIENGKAKFGPYAITKRGVKATINSGLNAETLVYTGIAKQVPSGSIKFGPVSGEARNLIITRLNGNNVDVTAEGFTVSFRLSVDDAVNYVLIEEASGSGAYTVTDGVGTTVNPWVITPATLTVTAVSQSGTMIYSGVAQTPYIHTQVSAANGQTVTYLYSKTEGSGYVALDQITYKDVADAGTLYYKFTAPNHNDVTGSIQISMSPKELTPTITGVEYQYTYGDAFEVSFSGVADSLVGEDTLDLQGITQAYEYSSYVNKAWSDWASLTLPGMVEIRNAGQHKIRYNFTCTSGNYVSHGAVVREMLIVHKALTIIPVDGQSKTYGEDDPVFTYTVSGSQYDDNIVPGDTFFTGKLERAYGFDAGTYAFVRGSLVVKAPYSANYYMGEIPEGKVFTINKATLTVTADNKTVTYGDAAPTYSATITGFVGFETEAQLRQNDKLSGAAALSCAYAAKDSVGSCAITASAGTLEATNYDFEYVAGTLTINAKVLTLSVVDYAASYTYGDEFYYNLDGLEGYLLSGDTTFNQGIHTTYEYRYKANLSYEWEDWESDYGLECIYHNPVGYYQIKFDFTCDSGNYIPAAAALSDVISLVPKTLTVTAKPKVIVYGDAPANDGVTYSDFAYSEDKGVLDGALTYAYSYAQGNGAGEYTITPSGLTSDNYNITFVPGALTVEKKALTVKAKDDKTFYGRDAHDFGVFYFGLTNGENESVLGGALDFDCEYNREDVDHRASGTYDIVPKGLTSDNYEITFENGTLTVKPRMITVTAKSKTITYGDAPANDGVTYSDDFVFGETSDVFTSPVTYEYTYVQYGAVGTYAITPSGAIADNYIFEYVDGALTVEKAMLTVTAKPNTITFGDAPANDGVTYSGFACSEDESVLDGTLAYAYSYEQYGAVGEYTITPSGLTASNYTIEFAAGVLTVQNADFTIIESPHQNGTLTYNGVVQRTSVSYTISSVHNTYVTYKYCKTQNGTYVTLNELDYLNVVDAGTLYYKVTAPNHNEYSGSFLVTMNKAALTVTANPKTINYGAAPANKGVAYSGLKGDDTASSLTGELAYAYTYAQGDPVGEYTITPSGLTSDNYNITFVPGALTVEKKALTVKAKDDKTFYGRDAHDFGVFYFGLTNGENESVLGGALDFDCEYNREDVDHRASGTYDIVPKGLTSDNYEITFENGTLTVEKAMLTVTPTSGQSKEYGGADPAFTYDVTGEVNNEEPVLTGALSREEGEGVGAYGITIGTLALTDDEVNGNYELSFAAGVTFCVNKANLAITVAVTDWTYGESANVPEVGAGIQITGWKFDEDATLDDGRFLYVLYILKDSAMTFEEQQALIMGSVDWDDDAAVDEFFATYTVIPTDAGTYYVVVGLEDVANYNDAQGATEFTILQRPVNLTWTDCAGFVYSGSAFTVSATVSNKVGTDEVSVTGYEGNSAIGAGDYAATALGISNANYTLTDGTALSYDWSIAKAPLTVTANPKTITYGDAPTNDDVAYSGFKGDDTASSLTGELAYAYTYAKGNSVGEYTITPSGLTSDNYEITFLLGNLTVTKRAITINNTNNAAFAYVYGDPEVYGLQSTMASILSVSGNGFASGDQPEIVFALTLAVGATRENASPILQQLSGSNFGYAATYWLYIIPINNNYDVTVDFDDNAKLVISPKALTITADDKTITYGDAAPEFTVSADGFVGGNYNDSLQKHKDGKELSVTCDYSVTAAATRGVGTYAITPSNWENGNYSVTFVPGTLTVVKKSVTITWGETNLVYNKTAQMPVFTLGDMVFGDDVPEVDVTVNDVAVNVGNYTITLSGISDENYKLPVEASKTFTIVRRAATVTADNKESEVECDLVELTAVATGILEGDVVYTLSTSANKEIVGVYPILISLTGNGNYYVTAINGSYTVTTDVTIGTGEDGSKIVEGKESIDKDAVKEGDGVSIKNMIKKVIDAAAEAPVASLSIEIGDGALITFNKSALVELAKAEEVKITYVETLAGDIDKSNKRLRNAELVIQISLGDVTFAGGTATVTTAFDNQAPKGKKAVVYYVDEKGKKTDMKAAFKDGTVTFTTGHFSTYAVEYVLSGGTIAGIVVGSVAGAAVIGFCVYFFLFRKKSKKSADAE